MLDSELMELNFQLRKAVYDGNIEEVKILIEKKGADINQQIYTRYTPLMNAILHNNLDIAKYLIDQKADINLSSTVGNTALHLASEEGYFDIVQTLIKNGVNINAQTCSGTRPLLKAIRNGHFEIAKLLVKHGAEVTPDIFKIVAINTLLQQLGVDPNTAVNGKKLLTLAIENNQLNVASYLISAGATVTPEIMKTKNAQAIKQIACSRVFHFYDAGVSKNQYANNNLEN